MLSGLSRVLLGRLSVVLWLLRIGDGCSICAYCTVARFRLSDSDTCVQESASHCHRRCHRHSLRQAPHSSWNVAREIEAAQCSWKRRFYPLDHSLHDWAHVRWKHLSLDRRQGMLRLFIHECRIHEYLSRCPSSKTDNTFAVSRSAHRWCRGSPGLDCTGTILRQVPDRSLRDFVRKQDDSDGLPRDVHSRDLRTKNLPQRLS